MNKFYILIFFCISNIFAYGQKDLDTVYFIFDDNKKEMRKVDFTDLQNRDKVNKLERSVTYFVKQKDPIPGYPSEFKFSHVHFSKEKYEKFGGQRPKILTKPKNWLNSKKTLDFSYFSETSATKVIEKFEEECSIFFLIDANEPTPDSIILRELKFTPPLIQ